MLQKEQQLVTATKTPSEFQFKAAMSIVNSTFGETLHAVAASAIIADAFCLDDPLYSVQ